MTIPRRASGANLSRRDVKSHCTNQELSDDHNRHHDRDQLERRSGSR